MAPTDFTPTAARAASAGENNPPGRGQPTVPRNNDLAGRHLRVLILSASDAKGGAARVARQTAEGLLAGGHSVELHASSVAQPAPFVHPLPPVWPVVDPMSGRNRPDGDSTARGRVGALLQRWQRRFWPGLWQRFLKMAGWETLNLDSPFPRSLGKALLGRFDVIHLHDLPSGFNLAHLPWLTRQVPTVWTIHSMAPLTGGCLYAYGCPRWRATCHHCPQWGQWPLHYLRRDASREVQWLRRWFYRRSPALFPVGVSPWIAQCIRESVLGQAKPQRVRVIENVVDAAQFFPEDRLACRAALGIPEGAFAILFSVAGDVRDRRKGLDIIEAALQHWLSSEDGAAANHGLFLLPTGINRSPQLSEIFQGVPGRAPAHLESHAELRAYYSAADVVWHPTRADTSSMVALEAFACGTPVIAAAVGGVPSVVQHEVNGLLIPPEDPTALLTATRRLMTEPTLREQLHLGALESARTRSIDRLVADTLAVYGEARVAWQ